MALTEIIADTLAINAVKNGITQNAGDITNGNKILYSSGLGLRFKAATADVTVTITSDTNPYDGSSKSITAVCASAGTPVAIGNLSSLFAVDGQYINISYTTSGGTITVEAVQRAIP